MAELLLELLSEEIPARMQKRAAEDLRRLLTDRLGALGVATADARAFATPRRLALLVKGLSQQQPDVTEERKGPRVGAPEQAVQGFLRANGLTSLDTCEKRTVGKAEFWYLVVAKPGGPTADILRQVIPEVVAAFPWPKSMRWGRSRRSWVRPLRRALCLFGGKPLELLLDFGGVAIRSGSETEGHRFLAPGPVAVSSFADYRQKLRARKVMLNAVDRMLLIAERSRVLAEAEGLVVKEDEGLLEEVGGLVEWPVPLLGRIDESFMDVPQEVLTTSMRAHQKYFALLRPDGRLAPRFLLVANMETADAGRTIVAGNERVLRARLSDAKFFWEADRQVPLADRLPALDGMVFHAKLGTMRHKVERIEGLAAWLAARIPGCDAGMAREAARLCKADLATGMVGEFPELQGIMGRYYAVGQGVKTAVAEAIADHYRPLGPSDACPRAPVSVAVALADKLDTLVGFFAIGEKPTGSKDPFALRRATLGIIRLLVENGLRIPLREALQEALRRYQAQASAAAVIEGLSRIAPAPEQALAAFADEFLRDYFADRLKVGLREKGVRHDLISAVFAVPKPGGGIEDDAVRLLARVDALRQFLGTDDGANLLVAYRRAANILKIEEKKDGRSHADPADPKLLREAEETALAQALDGAMSAANAALLREQFGAAMAALAVLRRPVDAFFDKVTVNADDAKLRANRLRLLAAIRRTVGAVADFGAIEG